MLRGIGQQSTGISHGFALGRVNAGEHIGFIILHAALGGMVRMEKETVDNSSLRRH